jgi:hypothetical protein
MGGGHDRNDAKPPEPPTMARSRVQIATSYAPGVLLTWEGGKGICRSVPIERDISVLATTKETIIEMMGEFVENWRSRIVAQRPDAPIDLTLDRVFFDPRSDNIDINPSKFQPTSPDIVGYIPYPLIYRCGAPSPTGSGTCGSVREFRSVAEQARRPLPRKCHGHEARWTQIDVVYAHWSGNVEPLSPFNYTYDNNSNAIKRLESCGNCGSRAFRLKNDAPVFSEWSYICEGCGNSRDLKKADPEVLERLQGDLNAGGRQFEWIEVNMLPVSYRANSAYYTQRANFIELADEAVIKLMTRAGRSDLLRKLAEIHHIEFAEPTEEKIKDAVIAAGRDADWDEYEQFHSMAKKRETAGDHKRAKELREQASELREGWFSDDIVARGRILSQAIEQATEARAEGWARKYDPIRLTVQHDVFVQEHIRAKLNDHRTVDLRKPDVTLSQNWGNATAYKKEQDDVADLLSRIGIDELYLIKELPICDFSFGYTRVSPTPIYMREFGSRREPMPVRLKAFDPLPSPGGKRPIYVTQQKNEALYVKLDEDRVRRWLAENGIADVPPANIALGRAYLERYADFGQFLDAYKDRERSGIYPRSLPSYVYMLLHSLSHQLIHSLADASGLDRDGIGEHIFPADLAFVIYRKGMTPDLGNISAMWRNNAADFLRRAIDPRLLRCGSGSLCDKRGGACPACIMLGEVSCISSNLLLSRACLRGGSKPQWELAAAPDLVGYYDPKLKL